MTVLTLLLTFAYASVRYVVLGPVGAEHLPAYVANKAIAVFAAVALLYAAVAALRGHAAAARGWLGQSGAAMLAHVVLSLALLTPAYRPGLYAADGRLTGAGELALLAGAVAMPVWALGRNGATVRRTLALASALLLVHVAALGLPTWLRPSDWPGGMLPLTLLSALAALACLIAAARLR